MSTPLFELIEDEPASAAVTVAPQPLSVTELTFNIKSKIESNFSNVWIVGQVSNLSLPRSGHVYLTLKDENAQLPAVVWKSTMSKLRFRIKDGMEIVCRGRLDVYPPQGKYQMIVSEMDPKGIGSLEFAFRQLHERLSAAGLFEPSRKKPLPKMIQNVAVITSLSGAAIRDFLQVLGRRTRRVNVLILPVTVQGGGAAQEIADAIRTVHRIARDRPVDCIVVTRGGGSTEDLWAFNEEVLVRAVAASRIPVVSGVGHEIDVTLCDLAADVRALTPSEAAERIAPEDGELLRRLRQIEQRLEDLLEKRFRISRDRLHFLERHPVLIRPERIIEDRRRNVDLFEERLEHLIDRRIQIATEKLTLATASLEALSPLAILARGYSLTETADGKRLRSIREINNHDKIRTRVIDGFFESIVIKEES
jgi:exodeoxyribonuclease VII large subunit